VQRHSNNRTRDATTDDEGSWHTAVAKLSRNLKGPSLPANFDPAACLFGVLQCSSPAPRASSSQERIGSHPRVSARAPINGSYAEYTRAPASNVALIESELSWADLAAIPETYATAWTCLFRNLEIERGQLLVIRGASSSFGQAALKMAVKAGLRVIARPAIATTGQLGAERCKIERRDLSNHIADAKKIDAVRRDRT
jgi:D-arabinose 1-dehydrogenase-like Zn-dependent alcohol dehydrogenase